MYVSFRHSKHSGCGKLPIVVIDYFQVLVQVTPIRRVKTTCYQQRHEREMFRTMIDFSGLGPLSDFEGANGTSLGLVL